MVLGHAEQELSFIIVEEISRAISDSDSSIKWYVMILDKATERDAFNGWIERGWPCVAAPVHKTLVLWTAGSAFLSPISGCGIFIFVA